MPEKDKNIAVVCQGLTATVIPSYSPLESMRWIRQEDGSYIYVTDTYLLLNEERIRAVLGEDTYHALIASMARSASRSSSPLSNSDLSDSLKVGTLKSRYVQSASELAAYASSITSRFKGLLDYMKSSAEETSASSQPALSTEPAKTE